MYDNMFQTASDAEIIVEFYNFISPMKGIYIYEEGMPPIIGLDNSLRHDLVMLRCILAEELGHHFTSIGYCLQKKIFIVSMSE